MIKLQNNFTTLEQSKRLLELGVPADSADCSLLRIITDGGYCVTWKVDARDFIGQICEDYFPCWSVGRMIEILFICCNRDVMRFEKIYATRDLVQYCIHTFDNCVRLDTIDFSKLYKQNIEVEAIDLEIGESIEECEKKSIVNALEKTGGNRKKAAEILGIAERTIYRKIRTYHL